MELITRRKFHKLSGLTLLGMTLPHIPSSVMGNIPKIKMGQFGTTHSHASGKMEALRKLDDVFDIVGIVESDPERRKDVTQDKAYQDLTWMTEEQLFNVPGLQAVAVETEVDELLPVAERCIKAGLHIHLDKPPGKSIARLKQLLARARTKNLTVQMGYMFRYNPAFQFCMEAVHKGYLGDIFEVDGVISKTINKQTRIELTSTYTGSMMLLGCHLLDMVIAILGKPENMYSYRKRTLPDHDSLFDNELIICEYPNAIASVRSALVEVEGWVRRQFVVCGTEGTIEIKPLEPPQLKLALDRAKGEFKAGYQTITLPESSGRYDDQLRDFAEMIRGNKTLDFSMDHDLLVHELLLKASELI